jgi:hypothetical protein
VRAKFFPERLYKGFSTLFRKKIRKWNIELTLAGRRKGELVLVVGSASSELSSRLLIIIPTGTKGTERTPADETQEAGAAAAAATPVDNSIRTPARERPNTTDHKAHDSSDEDFDEHEYSEEEEDELEEAEEVDDDEIDQLAKELELIDPEEKSAGQVIMKPLMYAWYDANGRQRLTVDFLFLCLPEADFTPRVSRSGMSLEFAFVVPEAFFSPERLETASGGAITAEHANYVAFNNAVHARKKASTSYDSPFQVWQKVRLPFKVEDDFVTNTEDSLN